MNSKDGRRRPRKNKPTTSPRTLRERAWTLAIALAAQVLKHALDRWWTN